MTLSLRTALAPAFALALLAALAGCGSTRSRPTAAASAACRAEVDRVYAAQNRSELSQRDTRDTPFAANYLPGITSRGLGARFGRDNMESSCLSNAGVSGGAASTDSGTGPTFAPGPR